MKILPVLMAALAFESPVCDYKVGRFIESDRYANISICSEGSLFREDIGLRLSFSGKELVVYPKTNIGYNPQLFVGNFLDNGLDQVLYSVESGGSGGYSYYELYSFKNEKAEAVFVSSEFNPKIEASYVGDLVEIDYQGKKVYLDSSFSDCPKEDCSLYITEPNVVFPVYNIALGRYDIEVWQRVYGGFSANTFGYIITLLEVNEDGYKVLSISTSQM